MSENKQTDLELGKAAILDFWRAMLRRHDVDDRLLVLQWQQDCELPQWRMLTYCGAQRYDVVFETEDICPAFSKAHVLGKYQAKLLEVVERIKLECKS